MRFSELSLHADVQAALEAMGFEEATPVQADTIPILLSGRDLVAQAQTGTGKTAAFGIPLVEAARAGRRGLVLCPTRELAQQVQRELQAIAKNSPADVICLTGGAHFGDQVRALKHHPQAILVATPGRIVDHLGRGTVDLSGMAILVLDEADEMLSMGFQDDLDAIVAAMPTPRQTMLFSATVSPNIEQLARRALVDPAIVRSGARGAAAASVSQAYASVRPADRAEAMRRILAVEQPKAALVFCRTRDRVETLAGQLSELSPEALHGGMGQPMRDAAMRRFRSGRTKLLIATDVAARGLDVEEVELVVHDEPAADVDTYVHRTGRTGRAGRTGRSILLIAPQAMHKLNHVQRVAGRLERYVIPDDKAMADARAQRLWTDLADVQPDGAAEAVLEHALAQGLDVRAVALRAIHRLVVARQPAAGGPGAPGQAGANGAAASGPGHDGANGSSPSAGSGEGSDKTAISLKIGAVDGVRPGDVMGMLVHAGGLPPANVGRIDILPHVTMVEVPGDAATHLIGALHRAEFRGRRVLPRLAEDWKFKPLRR